MIYQFDQALPMPTKDLYDTAVMQMAITAAKDMYDRGEKRINDFYEKYGDFYSPIASDVDYVYNEGEGKIKNAIADLYARGIDPIRSAEGRAAVQQVIRSVNTAEIAKRKLRAKNAEEYYKNMGILKQKGLYNEDFSKFLGEDPNSWTSDFMGITSPTAYDDLNSHTTHWFDKVNRDAYLYTDESGFDYYGVRPEDLNAVMDQNMPDFLSSDYGKYQMELAKRQLGPNASTEDIVNKLRQNVVSANKEMTISPTRKMSKERELELEDYYNAKQAQRQFEYNKRLAQIKTSNSRKGSGDDDNDSEHDAAEGLFYRGLIHAGGADYEAEEDVDSAIEHARDNIINTQLKSYKYAKNTYKSNDKKIMNYIISASSIQEPIENFSKYISRPVINESSGSVQTVAGDDKILYSEEYLSTNLYGLKAASGVQIKSGGEGIKQGQIMTPTTNVSTLFFKDTDGQYKIGQFWEVYVSDSDDEGNAINGTAKKKYMKLPTTRAATTNMPNPTKTIDQSAKYRPNIIPDYKTKGLKNQGSRNVNKTEGAGTKPSYNGTLNSEAVRR